MFVACSPSEYLKDYSEQKGFSYIETPINRKISLVDDLRSIYNICRYIRKNKIGVVVGHTPKGGLVAMIAAAMCMVPKRIYFRHGLVYETSKGLKRILLKLVDRFASLCSTQVVCVSTSVLLKSAEDKLTRPSKLMILGKGTCNGVDAIGQFNPDILDNGKVAELRSKYGISSNDFVIGYSGRLVRDKGIVELVSAFENLQNAGNCKLLLVGMFESRDSLPEDIKNHILNNERIIYTGFINGGMEYYYALMDVYVLVSYREGFPTGVLEAQAMRKPVITTKVTGCCDSIVEGLTGLFTSHASDEIADRIDDIRLRGMINGCKGREWVIENFDSRIIWREIEKLY